MSDSNSNDKEDNEEILDNLVPYDILDQKQVPDNGGSFHTPIGMSEEMMELLRSMK